MVKKINDTKAACNLIKAIKKYRNKYIIGKGISVPIKIDDITLLCRTNLQHNIKTKKDTIGSNPIGFKNIQICPTTNKKLKCTNQNAIDYINKQRKYQKEFQLKNRMSKKEKKYCKIPKK